MIRGNWSLAAELKQNERKQQQKLQQRQKDDLRTSRLRDANPIKIYHQIQRLESLTNISDKDKNHLVRLKEDWDYIIKKKLHYEKVSEFLAQVEENEKKKKINESKLWGQESIYFNPELNPLGKVPNLEGTDQLPNLVKPLKGKYYSKPKRDPIIDTLKVVLPDGEPPRFYKLVQNTSKNKKLSPNSGAQVRQIEGNVEDDQDSEYEQEGELAPEEEEYAKRKHYNNDYV
ncbi:uncharacterized protein RJT21DRAFT_45981 [Scheffersomyces amazonensis]|uniref:uncharacterized protein n=1 Tax=Scheffersomyces amazonensis TaxID=1078765 RepID=UPI00315D0B90